MSDYAWINRKRRHTASLQPFFCQAFTFCCIVVVPVIFIVNAIILGVEWYEYVYENTSPCENAIRSLIGYATIYGVMVLWLLGYAIINTRRCRTRLYRSGTCGDYFKDIYEAIGVLLVIGIAAFNLYGSYIGTERSFIHACENLSASVYAMLIADIVITHIIFDLLLLAFVPLGIRKYQWI